MQEVLWRQKEQFSDGVGYSWIDGLKEYCESQVSDAELASAAHRFVHNPPGTKEGYLYRRIFEEHFGSCPAAAPTSSTVRHPSVRHAASASSK